jgi:hypothetical protein
MAHPPKDIAGEKFHRLTAIKFEYRKNGNDYWSAFCECGNKVVCRKGNITAPSTKTKSCGCLNHENTVLKGKNFKTHGMSTTKFYYVWNGMKRRCENPKTEKYKYYGAKGIKVEWKTFEEFRDDMYQGYVEHLEEYGKDTSIDRIDTYGNYCKLNCRWATAKEQANNKR